MVLAQGLYKIKNIQSGLMLDLLNNDPFDGAVIQVYPDNGTTAQQWVVRDQTPKGANEPTVTVQSNNENNKGLGFFASKTQDSGQKVLYTRFAWTVTLLDGDNDVYRITFTRGNTKLCLSTNGSSEPEVRLQNYNSGDAKQQWQFVLIKQI